MKPPFPKLKQLFDFTVSAIRQQTAGNKPELPKTPAIVATTHVASNNNPQHSEVKRPALKLSAIGTSASAILERRYGNKVVASSNTEQAEHESQSFTLEDLRRNWIIMCNNMPECDAANAERMKSMDVHITIFPEVMVTITNSILEKYMLQIKSNIEATLKRLLHNDDIKVSYHLAANEELKNKGLTQREVMEILYKTNPAIARLNNFFNFEIL